VTALHANNIETLSEARVFCVVAAATAHSAPVGVTAISRLAKLPISRVSRLLWEMSQRGLLEYTTNLKDRRTKRVRANFDAFN
jgi:DNA-binding MarR family transcriptional regulator